MSDMSTSDCVSVILLERSWDAVAGRSQIAILGRSRGTQSKQAPNCGNAISTGTESDCVPLRPGLGHPQCVPDFRESGRSDSSGTQSSRDAVTRGFEDTTIAHAAPNAAKIKEKW